MGNLGSMRWRMVIKGEHLKKRKMKIHTRKRYREKELGKNGVGERRKKDLSGLQLEERSVQLCCLNASSQKISEQIRFISDNGQ
jgi:hypothetical protein